jgi:hypothetical protein
MTSIGILLEHTETINMKNLFLILKTYTDSEDRMIRNLYVIGRNISINKQVSIFHTISASKIKKMTYIDFLL